MTTIHPMSDTQLAGLRAELVDVWLEVVNDCDGDISRASQDIRDLLCLLARHDAIEDQVSAARESVAEALGDIALGDTPRAQQRLRELLDVLVADITQPDAGVTGVDGNLDPKTPADGCDIQAMRGVMEEGCDRD